MSELAIVVNPLSESEARILTDEVKRDAASLWSKLLRLYDGGAHTALSYSSWGAYCEDEFEMGSDRAYQLLQAGRVIATIGATDHGRLNERQARELTPLLDQPETLREAYAEVRELHPEPTAADVREAVGRRMDVHYSSERDDWATPQDFFDRLYDEFDFTLDVCATTASTKCPRFFSSEQNGLAQEWTGTCWMNPPYGDEIVRWVEKAWKSAKVGATIVCLVPARVETGWWWDYCRFGEIRFLRGRLRFGGGNAGAPFPSAIVIFGDEYPATVRWWDWKTA